jgi:hypothetical protein
MQGPQMTRNSGRNTDGTFAQGNSGKPRGARHKTTQAVLALMEGEGEAITRKAVALALTGDRAALRLCLDRIAPCPKDAAVSFDLPPLSDAQSAAQAMAALIGAVATGDLTPSEAASVAALVDGWRKAHETAELEARIAALEAGNGKA